MPPNPPITNVITLLLEPLIPYVKFVKGTNGHIVQGSPSVDLADGTSVNVQVRVNGCVFGGRKWPLTTVEEIDLVYDALQEETTSFARQIKQASHREFPIVDHGHRTVTIDQYYGKDADPPDVPDFPLASTGKYFTATTMRTFNEIRLVDRKKASELWLHMLARVDEVRYGRDLDQKAMNKYNQEQLKEIYARKMFNSSWAILSDSKKASLKFYLNRTGTGSTSKEFKKLVSACTGGNIEEIKNAIRKLGNPKVISDGKLGGCAHWYFQAKAILSHSERESPANAIKLARDETVRKFAMYKSSNEHSWRCKNCAVEIAKADMTQIVSAAYDGLNTPLVSTSGELKELMSSVGKAINSADLALAHPSAQKAIFHGIVNQLKENVLAQYSKVIPKDRGMSEELRSRYKKAYSMVYAYAAVSAMIVANADMSWASLDTKKVGGKAAAKITPNFVKKIVPNFSNEQEKQNRLEKAREDRKRKNARKMAEHYVANSVSRVLARTAQAELPVINAGLRHLEKSIAVIMTGLPMSRSVDKLYAMAYIWCRQELGQVEYTLPFDLHKVARDSFLYQHILWTIRNKGKRLSEEEEFEAVMRQSTVDVLTELNLGSTLEDLIENAYTKEDLAELAKSCPDGPDNFMWTYAYYTTKGEDNIDKKKATYAKSIPMYKLHEALLAVGVAPKKKPDRRIKSLTGSFCPTNGAPHRLYPHLLPAGAMELKCKDCASSYSYDASGELVKSVLAKKINDTDMQILVEAHGAVDGLFQMFKTMCPEGGLHEDKPCKKCGLKVTTESDPVLRQKYFIKHSKVYQQKRSNNDFVTKTDRKRVHPQPSIDYWLYSPGKSSASGIPSVPDENTVNKLAKAASVEPSELLALGLSKYENYQSSPNHLSYLLEIYTYARINQRIHNTITESGKIAVYNMNVEPWLLNKISRDGSKPSPMLPEVPSSYSKFEYEKRTLIEYNNLKPKLSAEVNSVWKPRCDALLSFILTKLAELLKVDKEFTVALVQELVSRSKLFQISQSSSGGGSSRFAEEDPDELPEPRQVNDTDAIDPMDAVDADMQAEDGERDDFD